MTHHRRLLGTLAIAALFTAHIACTERAKTTPDAPIKGAAPGAASKPIADAPKVPKLPAPGEAPEPGAPMVPSEGDVFKPSMASLRGDFDIHTFADASTCNECHAEVVSEWRESVHSFASLSNPMYLIAFDDFKKDKGAKNTQLCAGCHDIALMMSGKLVEDADPMDEASHAGVSCVSCHGIVDTRPRGNASYTLDAAFPIPAPDDQAAIDAHAKTLTERTRAQSNAMCVTCHRGVLTHESGHDVVIPGLDEFGSWRDSAYNGQHTDRLDDVAQQDCVSCHMPKVDGRSSHRFAGGHSTLAAMLGADAQLDAVRAQVEGAVTLDLMAARGHSPERLVFDVVVFNERVGHHFPGGAKDLRDTWLEVEVRDVEGRLVAQQGLEHAEDPDPTNAHVMQVRLASSLGETQGSHEVAHFRAPVFDHTIAPRDAEAMRYAMDLGQDGELATPLTITATVKHRRLTKTLVDRACELGQTPRGKAFLDGAERYKGIRPNPCVAQPILTVATVTGTVGTTIDVPAQSSLPQWLRHYRHGLAMLKHVQENLAETRKALDAALEALPEDAPKKDRAKIVSAIAKVQGRQGRTDESIATFMQADQLAPESPAIWYGMGESYMKVWRFDEAAAAFTVASDLTRDARIQRRLAIAHGSAKRPAHALAAAHVGLSIEPRDSHMLRSQMLSLRSLDVPEEWKTISADAFSTYKRDEQAPHIRDLCSRSSAECRRERVPIHVHELEPPTPSDSSER